MSDQLPSKAPRGAWIQTERAAHEAWAQFLGLRGATAASRVMHLLLARIGDHNAVVISQKTMAGLLKCDERTVQRAVAMLRDHKWIEIRQIGNTGTVNAYVINDRVAWSGPRDGIRYALFSAAVVLSADEQPDKDSLGEQKPLHRLPTMLPGEQQLPSGEGLPPPSQPSIPGMEPDLPARHIAPPTAPQTALPVDRAVLESWAGRPRGQRYSLARRVVGAQKAAGEIPVDAWALADHPAQLVSEATRLGLRF